MRKETHNLTVRNRDNDELTVVLEPWAEEYKLGKNSVLSIQIHAPDLADIETEIGRGIYSIWLWKGSRATVFVDGVDDTRSLSIPAPG